MQQVVVLTLLLSLVCLIHGVPVLPEPLFPIQDNFDLTKVRVSSVSHTMDHSHGSVSGFI